MADYYTVGSVRSQLARFAVADVKYAPAHFPQDWELFCPCIQAQGGSCVKARCMVKLGVFFQDPNLGRFPIDIIYVKGRQNGFVPTNNMKLVQFINEGKIEKSMLNLVSF